MRPGLSPSPPAAGRDFAGVTPQIEDLVRLRSDAHRLWLTPRKIVAAVQSGNYRSSFRGRGIDFDSSRAYQNGDDIRTMDWRVTARTGRAHVKVYHEERERPVHLAVDCGATMRFGTRVAFKSVVAARAATLVAWAAAEHGDRIGAVLFGIDRHVELVPTGGSRGVLSVIHALVNACASPCASNDNALTGAVERMRRVARPGSLIMLVSDFRGWDTKVARELGALAQRCDLILCFVYDGLEAEPPPPGFYRVSDGRAVSIVDAGQRRFSTQLRSTFTSRKDAVREFCTARGCPFIEMATDCDVAKQLATGLRLDVFGAHR